MALLESRSFHRLDDIVFSDILFIQRSSKNNIIRTWKAGKFNKRKLKFGWMPPHPSVIIKAEIFKKFGGFDEKFKISGDYDFLLRVFNVFEGKIIIESCSRSNTDLSEL